MPNWLTTVLAGFLPARTRSVRKARANPPTFPTLLQIEPTRRCNLKCRMCARTHDPLECLPDMPLELFKRVVSQFPSGLQTVHIQGVGEPTLNPGLIAMIEFARSRGLKTSFNTNLVHLTDDMCERLVAAGHSEIIVSIETVDPELYTELRYPATVDRVLGNIRKLMEEKRRQGSALPVIKAHGILMRHLLPGIPELVRTLREIGVAHLHFIDFSDSGIDPELRLANGERLVDMVMSVTMDEASLRDAIARVKALDSPELHVSAPGDWGGVHLGRKQGAGVLTCVDLWERPYVTVDGRVTPCCFVPNPDVLCMGSLKTQTFEEIWFGEAYESLRQQHVTNRPPEICAKCQQLAYTFAEPSRWWGRPRVEQRYEKGFVSHAPSWRLARPCRYAARIAEMAHGAGNRPAQGWRSTATYLECLARDFYVRRRALFSRTPRVQCPLCGWRGYDFLMDDRGTYAVPREVCPHCGSRSAERLLGLYLRRREPAFFEMPQLVLQIPGHAGMRRLLAHNPRLTCVSGDRSAPDARRQGAIAFQSDPGRLPFPDAAFDCVLWLRPVSGAPATADDAAEIGRVLRPGGTAYVVVPRIKGAEIPWPPREHSAGLVGSPGEIQAVEFLSNEEMGRFRIRINDAALCRVEKRDASNA